MGCNMSFEQFRHLGSDFERLPDRQYISFREWFTYNPFDDSSGPQSCYQYLCTLVIFRLSFALIFITTFGLSVYGVAAGVFGSSCSNDDHDCESSDMLKIFAYIHVGVYLIICFLLLWPAAWAAARVRGLTVMVLLAYPVVFGWAIHYSLSDECHDYYQDNCHSTYEYWEKTKIWDLSLMLLAAIVEICALAVPVDEDDPAASGEGRFDLSVIDFLFGKENSEWRRPLLVSSKVNEYSNDLQKWRDVVSRRNKTLEAAVQIADSQQQDSSNQAKLLGKYSSLINQTTEKVSRASNMLDDQSKKIGELNNAVDSVISAMGSSTDFSNISSAFSMSASDCRAWCLVIVMCLIVGIGVLIGLPKWLKLFNISFGISI